MNVNGADGFIVLLLLFGAWRGFRSGFVVSLYGLLSLVLNLYLASLLRGPLTGLITPYLPLPNQTVEPVAFLAAFSVVSVITGLIGGTIVRVLRAMLHRIPLVAALDRVVGIIPGALQHLVIAASLIAVLSLFVQEGTPLSNQLRSSTLAPVVDWIGRLIVDRAISGR